MPKRSPKTAEMFNPVREKLVGYLAEQLTRGELSQKKLSTKIGFSNGWMSAVLSKPVSHPTSIETLLCVLTAAGCRVAIIVTSPNGDPLTIRLPLESPLEVHTEAHSEAPKERER